MNYQRDTSNLENQGSGPPTHVVVGPKPFCKPIPMTSVTCQPIRRHVALWGAYAIVRTDRRFARTSVRKVKSIDSLTALSTKAGASQPLLQLHLLRGSQGDHAAKWDFTLFQVISTW